MLKWMGIVIVVCGSTALGVYKSGIYVSRLNNLYEIKKAFLYIQGEIRYMNTPMPEIFEAVAKRIKGPFRRFFLKMAGSLEQKNAGNFKEVWKCCLEKEILGEALEKEAREEFLEMGGQLGGMDRQAQEKAIDYFLEKWEFIIEKRRKEKSNRLRLYYICGVMGGLLLVMVLV